MAGKEINITLGKNVQLIGFDILEPSEISVIQHLLLNYIKKIENKTNYELLKLKLKMHQHSKMFMHELKAELFIHPGMVIGSILTHKNLYKGTSTIMKKLLSEIEHLKKRSPRNRPIKKLSKKII
ncbi:MAG: hypothetical protein N3G19_01250 [Candidatus Pacearchaeota archaeon]|nr:hypothetical protein [Candidatus Pacearchaeota archaeon]